jgi:hypothetical protein
MPLNGLCTNATRTCHTEGLPERFVFPPASMYEERRTPQLGFILVNFSEELIASNFDGRVLTFGVSN